MRLAAWLRCAGLIVAALILWVVAHSALAQGSYTVTDIPADATAEDAVAAREQAILQAQREGLSRLFGQLAPGTPEADLPDVTNVPVEQYVRSFEIASEQVGARRYVGRLNVTYQGDRVRDALRRSGLSPPAPAVPTLLLPAITQNGSLGLWWEAEAWRNALGSAAAAAQDRKLSVALGDADDLTTLTPEKLAARDEDAIGGLSRRYGAQRVVLVTLKGSTEQPSGVELQDVSPGGSGYLEVPLEPGTASLDDAARSAVAAVANMRKAPPPATLTQVITVAVPFASLSEWVQLRRALEANENVRDLRVDRFARDEAQLTLTVVGDMTRLQNTLGQRGLSLLMEGGGWQLLPAGAPGQQAF